MSQVPMSRQANRASFLAGSERLLRVHHRNSVFSRDLQQNLEKLDVTCRKKLSKFQQAIFNVYHNEFVPIREEACALRLPKLPLTVLNLRADDMKGVTMSGRQKAGNIGRKHRSLWPLSCSKPGTIEQQTVSQVESNYEPFDDNELPMHKYTLKEILDLPPMLRQNVGKLWKNELNKQTTSFLSDSDIEDSSELDSDTFKRIKKAIALTSQPSKPKKSKKDKMLRRSFLLSLRRTSKTVWHNEMLQRVGGDDGMFSPSDSVSREAKLAKLFMLSTSQTSFQSGADSTSKDGGRQSNHSLHNDRLRWRENTCESDISSDNDECPESPAYFSEISEEPSYLTDTESDTSYSSYSDSDDTDSA